MGEWVSRCTSVFTACLLLSGATVAQAGTIIGSKHDLGNGAQVCGYCHAPHNASKQEGLVDAPLWNRRITNLDAFFPYASPTMTETCPTRPSGISLACLSCHDGTEAGAVFTGPGTGDNLSANGHSAVYKNTEGLNDQHIPINAGKAGGGTPLICAKCHDPLDMVFYAPRKALTEMAGPDLRNDHPISMQYPLANANFISPPDAAKGWGDIKLYDGKVECPTCHNVHDPTNAPFLRATNMGSALCLRCHIK